MKKLFSLLLVVAMLATLLVPTVLADESYDGKTVIVYSGNLRGDVDAYAKLAAAKADFASKGASVYLVDAGNYLQGTTYANSYRGESIYNLMDKAGYDVAAMGAYEFTYGDATTGFMYHSNFYKYHTQAQLYKGATGETYNQNYAGTATATIGDKAPANFAVISSNLSGEGDYYAFDANKVLGNVGFVALTDENLADMLQDGFLDGYSFGEAAVPECDILVCLSNNGKTVDGAALTINAPTNGEPIMGAYVIDNTTKEVSAVNLPELSDDTVAAAAAAVKAAAKDVIGTSNVVLNGADSANWCSETNLGDLTADALLWYATNKFDGFKKDVPVVAIQNGGNCDQFLYTGDITETDLLRSLPFSPMGVGILYVTGAELLETLEAGTSPSESYGDKLCPGFAQVAGLEYTVDTYKEYDAGAAYGKFYEADSINRVTITSVNGQAFDENATYAVIADNYLMNGNDTYYVFKAAKSAEGAQYLNNGNGVKTRDIVAMYIRQELGGTIGAAYAAPQGRITVQSTPVHVCPFSDIADSAHHTNIETAYERGYVSGYGEGKYAPDETVTRAQFITMLWRAAGKPAPESTDLSFTDIAADDYCREAIAWGAEKGIVSGYDTNTFGRNDSVSRAQATTFIARYCEKILGMSLNTANYGFLDINDAPAYAVSNINAMANAGIILGYGTTCGPTDKATRGQIASILVRAMDTIAA